MTLTLDEVRNIRFPMARKPAEDGYRASAVDNFIDRFEVSYAKLIEDNEALRAQVTEGGAEPFDDSALREQIAKLESENESLRATSNDLTVQIEQLRQKESAASDELGQLRAETVDYDSQTASLREENNRLQDMLNDANVRIDSLLKSQKSSDGQNAELNGLTAEIEVLRARNRQLENELGQLGETRSELEGVRARNSELEVAVTKLNHDVEVAQQKAEDAVASLNAAVEAHLPIDPSQPLAVTTTAEASAAVVHLVALATAQAEGVTREAEAEAFRVRDEAQSEADRMVNEAIEAADSLSRESTVEAERMQREAKENAERVTREAQQVAERVLYEAQSRADRVNGEASERRREIFKTLEEERDLFAAKIAQLRDYESHYRSSMVQHLQKNLDELNNLSWSPKQHLSALDKGPLTPRLDALISEDYTR